MIPYNYSKPLDMASLAIYTLERKEFDQEDESREEVREKKKHKNHKGRDDR